LVRLRSTLDDINENNLKIIDSDKKRAVLKEKLEKSKEKAKELDVKLFLKVDGLTIEELRYVLEAMGLKKTGTKSVLIARIVKNGLSTELKTIFSTYTVPERENEIKECVDEISIISKKIKDEKKRLAPYEKEVQTTSMASAVTTEGRWTLTILILLVVVVFLPLAPIESNVESIPGHDWIMQQSCDVAENGCWEDDGIPDQKQFRQGLGMTFIIGLVAILIGAACFLLGTPGAVIGSLFIIVGIFLGILMWLWGTLALGWFEVWAGNPYWIVPLLISIVSFVRAPKKVEEMSEKLEKAQEKIKKEGVLLGDLKIELSKKKSQLSNKKGRIAGAKRRIRKIEERSAELAKKEIEIASLNAKFVKIDIYIKELKVENEEYYESIKSLVPYSYMLE